jgi:hypothetical protein
LDIVTFAPRSVKSDGDFEDILAADHPAVWTTNRPAKSGESGEQFAAIIERAAALKAGRDAPAKKAPAPKTAATPTKGTKGTRSKTVAGRASATRKPAGATAKKRSGRVGSGAAAKPPKR